MKKILIGLASTFLIVGISATAIYASEKELVEDDMTSVIEVFEPGTMETEVEGVQMNKEVIDSLSVDIEVFDEGTLEDRSEGKELLMKEVIEE